MDLIELSEEFMKNTVMDYYGAARKMLSVKQSNWLMGLIRTNKLERRRSRTLDYNGSIVYEWHTATHRFKAFWHVDRFRLTKTDKAIYSKVVNGFDYTLGKEEQTYV